MEKYFLVPTVKNFDPDGTPVVCDVPFRVIHIYTDNRGAVVACYGVPSIGFEMNLDDELQRRVLISHGEALA
jgi:hypothetical protein